MDLLAAWSRYRWHQYRGVAWLGEQITDVAEQEYYTQPRSVDELRQLAESLDNGDITEERLDAAEDEVLDRLEEAEVYRADRPLKRFADEATAGQGS